MLSSEALARLDVYFSTGIVNMSLAATSLQTRPAFAGQAIEQRQTRTQRSVAPAAVRAQAEEQAVREAFGAAIGSVLQLDRQHCLLIRCR